MTNSKKSKAKRSKKSFLRLNKKHHFYLSLAIFILSVLLSRNVDMHEWEISLFKLIYNTPEFLRPVFFVITQLGSIHTLGILLVILLIKKQYGFFSKMLFGSTLTYMIAGFAKDIWGRMRPHEVLPNIVNLDYEVRGPGFPSGHTALATILVLMLIKYLPRPFKFAGYILIALIGYSRIYLGIHAPLDILGGFAIGYFVYALLLHVHISDIVSASRKKIKSKK